MKLLWDYEACRTACDELKIGNAVRVGSLVLPFTAIPSVHLMFSSLYSPRRVVSFPNYCFELNGIANHFADLCSTLRGF